MISIAMPAKIVRRVPSRRGTAGKKKLATIMPKIGMALFKPMTVGSTPQTSRMTDSIEMKTPKEMPAINAQIIIAVRLLRRWDGVNSVAGAVASEVVSEGMGHKMLIRGPGSGWRGCRRRIDCISTLARNFKESGKLHDVARQEAILFRSVNHGTILTLDLANPVVVAWGNRRAGITTPTEDGCWRAQRAGNTRRLHG